MSLGESWSAGRCCWDVSQGLWRVSICRWWLSQAGRCAERCRSRKLMMEKKIVIHLIRGPCWYNHYLNQKCEHVVLGRRSWIFVAGLPNTRTLNSGFVFGNLILHRYVRQFLFARMDSIHAKHGRGIHPARKRAVVGCCKHPSGRNAEGFVKCCTMYFVSLIFAWDSYFSVVLRPNKTVLGMRTATPYRNLSSDSYEGWDWE